MQEMAAGVLEELDAAAVGPDGKALTLTKGQREHRGSSRQRAQELWNAGVTVVQQAEEAVLNNAQVCISAICGAMPSSLYH